MSRQTDYLLELGGEFFAHMPKLHTFCLSDEPYMHESECNFSHAQDESLQRQILARWDEHTTALSYVALTTLFHWEKIGGEWRASERTKTT